MNTSKSSSGQSRRRPQFITTSLVAVAMLSGMGSIAVAQNAGSFAEKIGNTTAFEEPASTYLHCMVLLTAYDSIPDAVAGLNNGMVKTIFGKSKKEIQAAVAASKGYADAFSAKIATLDPPLSAEQQLSYTGEFNTVMSSDMAAMLASPDQERCLSYAAEHGIAP